MKQDPYLKDIPISGIGGIETWEDCAEFIALGCTNLQFTTSIMQYGYRIVEGHDKRLVYLDGGKGL